MKDVLVILPIKNFSVSEFERGIFFVKEEFGDVDIRVFCHKLSKEYYSEILPDTEVSVMIDSDEVFNTLTVDMISKVYDDSLNFEEYRVVLFSNMDNEISVKPSLDEDYIAYRWYVLNNVFWSLDEEIREEEDPEIESTVFSRMAKRNRGLFSLVPYSFKVRFPGLGYINENGFRVPKDYQKLKDREADHKLICFFGGSACYSMCSRDSEMFCHVLEGLLNDGGGKYTVLNFGMMGHLLMDEMVTFMQYAYELNPDVVVSFSGLNDFVCGMVTDTLMLDKFKLSYNYRYEQWIKHLNSSPEELVWKEHVSFRNINNTPLMIIDAYYQRKKQFEATVQGLGAKFVSVIQPFALSKIGLSDSEIKRINFYTDKGIYKELPSLKNIFDKYSKYEKKMGTFKYSVNFHEQFKNLGSECSYFNDSAHFAPEGDKYIADMLYKYFKENLLEAI